mmetsp:Transcript_33956/g.52918  ORF Transcript_33956/g.52918 Transcript_33956/m.52918 type:complete len:244 (+) Transcript_33956:1866-2597(+)
MLLTVENNNTLHRSFDQDLLGFLLQLFILFLFLFSVVIIACLCLSPWSPSLLSHLFLQPIQVLLLTLDILSLCLLHPFIYAKIFLSCPFGSQALCHFSINFLLTPAISCPVATNIGITLLTWGTAALTWAPNTIILCLYPLRSGASCLGTGASPICTSSLALFVGLVRILLTPQRWSIALTGTSRSFCCSHRQLPNGLTIVFSHVKWQSVRIPSKDIIWCNSVAWSQISPASSQCSHDCGKMC